MGFSLRHSLLLVAALAASGCRAPAPTFNPFAGQTTVPPPGTGAATPLSDDPYYRNAPPSPGGSVPTQPYVPPAVNIPGNNGTYAPPSSYQSPYGASINGTSGNPTTPSAQPTLGHTLFTSGRENRWENRTNITGAVSTPEPPITGRYADEPASQIQIPTGGSNYNPRPGASTAPYPSSTAAAAPRSTQPRSNAGTSTVTDIMDLPPAPGGATSGGSGRYDGGNNYNGTNTYAPAPSSPAVGDRYGSPQTSNTPREPYAPGGTGDGTPYREASWTGNSNQTTSDPNRNPSLAGNSGAPANNTGNNPPAGNNASGVPLGRGAYNYDNQYSQLSGRLEYSRISRRWKLRYIAVSDGQSDAFGGSVTLVDDPRLESFQDGEFVTVTGQLSGPASGFAPPYVINRIVPQ